MHFKLLQKEQFKKQCKELGIWLVIKLLIISQKFPKIHNKIIQKQLKMSIINKYLKNIKKKTNLWDNTPNKPSKVRIKNWVESNDEECGTYNTNSQIKFETLMLSSNLYDHSDTYILPKGTISVAAQAGDNPKKWK